MANPTTLSCPQCRKAVQENQAVGGENDGASRQLARFVRDVAPRELTE
jgi:hypothetical protein